jgi:hypothetical protein
MRCANVSSMHRRSITMRSSAQRLATLLVPFSLIAFAAHATEDSGIGTAIAITTNVTGASAPTDTIVLKTGDAVFQNEVIVTDEKGYRPIRIRRQNQTGHRPGLDRGHR